jgi:hypothetical protein
MQLTPLVLALSLLVSLDAAAEPIRGDFEVDPTAYLLNGNSLHVGIARGNLRVDLGNFGLELPRFVHGNDELDVRFDGAGAKLQWFPRAEQRGLFVGVQASVTRVLVERRGMDLAARDYQVGTGVQVGYRIALSAGLYITPWIGVDYQWSADDLMLDGATYEASRWTVFPAIHLGYRFQ